MSHEVVVTGMSLLSAAGDSPESVAQSLSKGQRQTFEREPQSGQVWFPIRDFDPKSYLGDENFRPVDRAGQLAIVAATRACESAGWHEDARQEQEIGLCLGTVFSGLGTIMAFDRIIATKGPRFVKPMDFANTVINAATGQTALWLNLRGINATIAGGSASGLQAVMYAADQIRLGKAEVVLAGGVEELSLEALAALARTGQLAPSSNEALPFAKTRKGYLPAEGAALLVLESAAHAMARQAPVLATLLGYADGFELNRRWENPHLISTSMKRALSLAECTPDDISAVFVSANGDPLRDAVEARALAEVFGECGVPIAALKGGLGEALAAGGAMVCVAALASAKAGYLPGNGPFEFAPDLPALDLREGPRKLDMQRIMVMSVSQDGTVAATVWQMGQGQLGKQN